MYVLILDSAIPTELGTHSQRQRCHLEWEKDRYSNGGGRLGDQRWIPHSR